MEFTELEKTLREASNNVREAVDIIVAMRMKNPECNDGITKMWEQFLGDFIGYVKEKGRETGYNLMAGISFSRIMK